MPKNSKFEALNSTTYNLLTGSDALHVRQGSSRFSLNVLKMEQEMHWLEQERTTQFS